MLSVHPSHSNCQLLPVLLCFLKIIFGLIFLSTCRLDYFFPLFLQNIIFCCWLLRGSENVLHNGTHSGAKSLEFGNTNAHVLDTHLTISHFGLLFLFTLDPGLQALSSSVFSQSSSVVDEIVVIVVQIFLSPALT